MNTYTIEVKAVGCTRDLAYEMDSDNFRADGVSNLKVIIEKAYANGYLVEKVWREDANSTCTDMTARYVKRARITANATDVVCECGATQESLIPAIKRTVKEEECGVMVEFLHGYIPCSMEKAMVRNGFTLDKIEEHVCGTVEFYSIEDVQGGYIRHTVAIWYNRR